MVAVLVAVGTVKVGVVLGETVGVLVAVATVAVGVEVCDGVIEPVPVGEGTVTVGELVAVGTVAVAVLVAVGTVAVSVLVAVLVGVFNGVQ